MVFAVTIIILSAFYVPAANRRFSTDNYRSTSKIIIRYNTDNSKYKSDAGKSPSSSDIVTQVRNEINYILDYGYYKNHFKTSDYQVNPDDAHKQIVITGDKKVLDVVGNFNKLLSNGNVVTITTDTGGTLYGGATNPLSPKWKNPNPTIGPNDFQSKPDKYKNNWKTALGDYYEKPFEGNIFSSYSSVINTTTNQYNLQFTVSDTTQFSDFTKYLYYYSLLQGQSKKGKPYDPSNPQTGKLSNFRLYFWINYQDFLTRINTPLSSFNAFDYCFKQNGGTWSDTNPNNTQINPNALPTLPSSGESYGYHPSGLMGVYTINNTSTFVNGISDGKLNFQNKPASGGTYSTFHFIPSFSKQTSAYLNLFANNAAKNYLYNLFSSGFYNPRLGYDTTVFYMYGICFLVFGVLFAILLIIRMRLWGVFASVLLLAFTGVFISALIYSQVAWGILIALPFMAGLIMMMYQTLFYFNRMKRAMRLNKDAPLLAAWHASRSRQTWFRIADFVIISLIFTNIFYVVAQGSLHSASFFITLSAALTYVLMFLGLQIITSTLLTSPAFHSRLHLLGLAPFNRKKRTAQQLSFNKSKIDALQVNDSEKNDYGEFFNKTTSFWKRLFGNKKFFAKTHQSFVNQDISDPITNLKGKKIISKNITVLFTSCLSLIIITFITLGALFATILGPVNGNSDLYGSTNYYFTNVSLSKIDSDSPAIKSLENDINNYLKNKNYQYYITQGHYGSTQNPSPSPKGDLIQNAIILNVEANDKQITATTKFLSNLKDLKTYNLVYQGNQTLNPTTSVDLILKSIFLALTYSLLALTAYLMIRISVAGALAYFFSSFLAALATIFGLILLHFTFSYAAIFAIWIGIFFGLYFFTNILSKTRAYFRAWFKKNHLKVIKPGDILSIMLGTMKNEWKMLVIGYGLFIFINALLIILIPYYLWVGLAGIVSLILFSFFYFALMPLTFSIFAWIQSVLMRKYMKRSKKLNVAPEEEVIETMNKVHDV